MFENIPIGTVIVSYVAVLFSLSVHEASHAGTAYLLDDDTAARQGRMTLNPIAHIDWIGTVLLPLMGMITGWRVLGWAKPVPVDPTRLTRKFPMRLGYAMVAGAGPASNFLMSALFMVLLGLYVRLGFPTDPYERVRLFSMAIAYPVEDLLRTGQFSVGQVVALTLMGRLVIINVGLAIFNLLPVGPLDGAGILRGFLPQRYIETFDRIQPTISIILLVMFLAGFIGVILGPLFWLADTFYITPFARLILGV